MPLLQRKRYLNLNHAGIYSPAGSPTLLDGSESDGTNLLTGGVGMTSGWTGIACTLNTAFATAPDGTTTAARMVEGATTNRHVEYQQKTGYNGLGTGHFSVYAKYVSRRYLQVLISSSKSVSAYFDLQGGVVTDSDLIASATSISNVTMTAAVNGFYKCEFDFVLGTSGSDGPYCILAMSDVATYGAPLTSDNPSYLGDGTANLLVWRPKLT